MEDKKEETKVRRAQYLTLGGESLQTLWPAPNRQSRDGLCFNSIFLKAISSL